MGLEDLLICYNFLPLTADHALDFPTEFYESHGLKRMHNMEMLRPEDVRTGDVIFVKTDFIVNDTFRTQFFDRINLANWFSIVTGNSAYQLGRDGGDNYLKMLNHPTLRKWYCTHPPETDNSKIVPLPIGFEEPGRMGGNQNLLYEFLNTNPQAVDKVDKVFLPYHTANTNAARNWAISHLGGLNNVAVQTDKQEFSDYLYSLQKHKYVVCLEGAGPDTHRNYETLLAGSIPIIKSSSIRALFEKYELPAIFVDSWEDVTDFFIQNLDYSQYNFDSVEKFLKAETHVKEVRSER